MVWWIAKTPPVRGIAIAATSAGPSRQHHPAPDRPIPCHQRRAGRGKEPRMSKHIPAREQPLKADPHSGSSPSSPARAPKTGHKSAPSTPQAGGSVLSSPSDQQIAVRAYEIWLEKGKPEGTDRDDW